MAQPGVLPDSRVGNHAYRVDPGLAHRRCDAEVTLLQADGGLLADTEVTVAQRRHAVLFGCTGFELVPLANGEAEESLSPLAEDWLGLFDTATLPFYWGQFEPGRGRPDTARLQAAARWFADRGCRVKGHPLAWHTLAPDWLLPMSEPEVLEAQLARIRRDVTDFAGLVDLWDVINEVVIMPVFDKYENGLTRLCREIGRIRTIQAVFEEARGAHPGATLLLNDFDMSTAYECLIEGCLEAGVRIDAIGLQSHMHQGYWGEERTLEVLDRFARYGLPLHLTETTLVSGELMPADIEDLNDFQPAAWPSTEVGEARQADEVVRHYRTLLSHPAVAAVTYWGLPDTGAWLGAPAGLLRPDGSRKPAYDAVRQLVRGEWWLAPTTTRTDQAGRLRISGFLGDYEVSTPAGTAGLVLDRAGGLATTVRVGTG